MKKLILILSLIIAVLISLVYALFDNSFTNFDSYYMSPTDGFYNLYQNNLVLTCNVTPKWNYSVSNISVWHNISGTWQINDTVNWTASGATAGTSRQSLFYINSTTDGTTFEWGCLAYINISTTAEYNLSGNRTVYNERLPLIQIVSPSTGSYSNATSRRIPIRINITGNSTNGGGGDTNYKCYIYENSTRNYTKNPTGFNLVNNSDLSNSTVYINNITYQFGADGVLNWNLECEEKLNPNVIGTMTSNRSIIVDTTNPSISLNSPSNSGYSSSSSVWFNTSLTELNKDTCKLYINTSTNNGYSNTDNISKWNSTNFNQSITSDSMNPSWINFTQKTLTADFQNLKWRVWCNDSAGNSVWSSLYTVSVDTGLPGLLRNINYSSLNKCKAFTVEFNFTKEVNATFKYGTSTMSRTTNLTESDFAINQTFLLTFDDSYETLFYANITFCDIEGNCNNTISELQINSPLPMCAGWSLWSIYDTSINMSNLYSNSNVDYLYYWNLTGQSWTAYDTATTGHGSYNLQIRDTAWFYTSTNETYFRNISGSSGYYINISNNTFFPLYHDYSFGNISYNIFRNDSGGNTTPSDIWAGGKYFIVEEFGSYNNSAQEWKLYYYGWSLDNSTKLGKTYKNYLDTLWVFSNFSLVVNFTPSGEVIGNWT